MKGFRSLFLIVAFVELGFAADAQFFIGGSLDINYSDLNSDDQKIKAWIFGARPEFGYRISNKLEAGLGGSVSYSKSNNDFYGFTYEKTYKTFGGFAYVQYNLFQFNKLNVAVQLIGDFSKTYSTMISDGSDDSELKTIGIFLSPKLEYRLNDKFTIFSKLEGVSYKVVDDESCSTDTFDVSLVNGCNFGVKYNF